MHRRHSLRRAKVTAMLAGLVMLATPLLAPDAKASPAEGEPVLTPVEGEPFPAPNGPPLPADYVQREYFLDGHARTYPGSTEERVPYRTRIIVKTPVDPETFSGTVHVEWYNVSAQNDTTPVYNDSFHAVHRRHDAWVGVSAQKAGVDFITRTNPARYGGLNHPGDDYSFDIFSQAGYLLENPGEHDALEGMRDADIRTMGTGNSQSASRLTSYIQNGALRDAGVYDSLLVLNGGSTTMVDGDLPSVPVVHMQSESEASPPQPSSERPTGRLEHPLYRLWWVAGTSHTLDYHSWCTFGGQGELGAAVGGDADRECGQYGELGGPRGVCGARPNMFPKRYAAAAAIDALDAWVRTGEPAPPSSAEFEYADGTLLRDADSNVLGGLRLAPIDVPVASYIGNSCALLGHTEPFQDPILRSRYATHNDYMALLEPAVAANIADGYLVPADAEDLLARAEAAAFRWEGPISAPYPVGGH